MLKYMHTYVTRKVTCACVHAMQCVLDKNMEYGHALLEIRLRSPLAGVSHLAIR